MTDTTQAYTTLLNNMRLDLAYDLILDVVGSVFDEDSESFRREYDKMPPEEKVAQLLWALLVAPPEYARIIHDVLYEIISNVGVDGLTQIARGQK